MTMHRVRVTSADFNGRSFDGFPFSEVSGWLMDAVRAGDIRVYVRDGLDYARWLVSTARGPVVAGPGDWISKSNGQLIVEQ